MKKQEKIRLDQKEQEKRLQEEKEKSMRQRLLRDRLPKLGNEDLDSFIQRFEDVAIEAEIPKNYWFIYFENYFTGQALERFQSCVTREHRAKYDTSRDVLWVIAKKKRFIPFFPKMTHIMVNR